VIRDYPKEAEWIREHLLVSGALLMADTPSAEKKSRARESILNTVGRSDPSAVVATRLRFGFPIAQAALIAVGCLGLAAGVAAASGVDLRSVAGQVVDSLVDPLPLSAETVHDTDETGDRGAGEEPSGAGQAVSQSADSRADEDGGLTPSDSADGGALANVNPPVQGDPPGEITPLCNNPPASNPTGGAGAPPVNVPSCVPKQGEQDCTDLGESDAPGQDHDPHGQPPGNSHGGSNNAAGQGGGQPGENDSNGSGSIDNGPNGSNGDPSNGPDGGGPNNQNNGAPSGSNQNSGGPAGQGGHK